MRGASISAIVPVHNGAALIAEALASIRAQSVPVGEVIVVDDGSDDGTAEIVAEADPAAMLIRTARGGPAAARNIGVARATGDWLAFLDHDDLWPPERTAALLAAVERAPDTDYAFGRFCLEEMAGAVPDPRLRQADGTAVPFLLHAALIRRRLWQALGGLDAARDRAEDLDFYLRVRDAGAVLTAVDAVTLIYRQHGGNRSRAAALGQAPMLEAMWSSIRRRRGQS